MGHAPKQLPPGIPVDRFVEDSRRFVAGGLGNTGSNHTSNRVVPKHRAPTAAKRGVARVVTGEFARKGAFDPWGAVGGESVRRIMVDEPRPIDR